MIKWLPTALFGAPDLTLKALLYWIRGFRVRAANLFAAAVARHPDFHDRWTTLKEPALFAQWHGTHPIGGPEPLGVGVTVLPGPADARADACSSAVAALDGQCLVRPADSLAATLLAARQAGFSWLAILAPHHRVSPQLGGVLASLGDLSGCDLVYWDSDRLIDGRRSMPIIKPNWDPLLARSSDVLSGCAIIRVTAALSLIAGKEEVAADEASTAALLNQLAQSNPATSPRHVPLILTHDTSRRCTSPLVIAAVVPPAFDRPGVSIIIPTRDQAELLAACVAGLDQLDYSGPIETIIIDNQSCEAATAELFERMATRAGTRILPWPDAFNFAAMMNYAADVAVHPILCLLNNDVTPLDSHWLDYLVAEAVQPDCGAVGARLLYPDGTIQHAGVALGIGGAAGHVQKGVDRDADYLANWHRASRRVSAVTGACLVVARDRYFAVGGMDADTFAVDFNDVDLCLKLDRAGWSNRIIVEATLIHHESKTRGKAISAAQKARFGRELAALQDRWKTLHHTDPWHSPLFRSESERCLLRL